MAIRPVSDPNGRHAVLVDKMIGTAYNVVKLVALNIAIVKHVSANLPIIDVVHENVPDINTVAANILQVNRVSSIIAEVVAVSTRLSEIVAVSGKLTQITNVNDSLSNVIAVSEKLTEINALYGQLAKLVAVHGSLEAIEGIYPQLLVIGQVHAQLARVVAVGQNIAAVVEVAEQIPLLQEMQTHVPLIETVGQELASIVATGEAIEEVKAVAASILAITEVSEKLPQIELAAGLLGRHVGICAIGDSITEGGRVEKYGWLRKLCFFSKQKYRFRGEFAVGGQTAEQIETAQLSQVLAMDPLPKSCVIAAGSNNLGTNASVDAGIDAVQRMAKALLAVGILPILWTVPPRGNLQDSIPFISRWNYKIQMLRSAYGFPLVDAAAALQDPATWGITPAGATFDGTHLTVLGCALLAKYVLADPAFAGAPVDGMPFLPVYNADPLNMAPNGLFMTNSGTAGLAANLTADANTTYTLTTDTAAKGRWQRFTRPNAGPASSTTPLDNISVVPGDVLEFTARLRVSAPTDLANGHWNNLFGLYFATAEYGFVGTAFLVSTTALASEEGVILERITVPEGAVNMNVLFAASNAAGLTGAIYAEVAQVSIRSVTTPGLVLL